MLQSSKLVLEACKSFKQPDVGGCGINDEIKNVGINEIKSLTFSQWILASNERRDDWIGDGTAEREERGPAWLGNETQSELENLSGALGRRNRNRFIDKFQLFLSYMC